MKLSTLRTGHDRVLIAEGGPPIHRWVMVGYTVLSRDEVRDGNRLRLGFARWGLWLRYVGVWARFSLRKIAPPACVLNAPGR